LIACASAAATCAVVLFTGFPLQAELVLLPKQAVAVKSPKSRDTVPESATSAGVAVFRSVEPHPQHEVKKTYSMF
jgi:hypothetical protein